MALCAVLIRLGHGGDKSAARAKYLEGTCLRVTTDEIEHRVGILDFVFEALRSKVHYCFCTEGPHVVDVFRSSRRDAAQASATSELNSICSDVSRGSMDDHRLASFEASLFEQTLPGRDGDDGNGGRFDIAQRGGLLREHPGGRHRVLSVSANEPGVGHAEDLIPDGHVGYVGTQSLDLTGQIRAQRERKRLR